MHPLPRFQESIPASRRIGFICAALALSLLALPGDCFGADEEDGAIGETKKSKIAIRISLKGAFTEQHRPSDPFMQFTGDSASTGVQHLIKKLDLAARTPGVASVLLAFDTPNLNWSHVESLRPAILRLRKAGKVVIAHGDYFTTGHYMLAAAANKIYISKMGLLLLNGLTAKQFFLKGTLDKLGISAEILSVGSHKGAGEPFTRVSPSKESQEMINWIMDDRYAFLCSEIGKLRGKDSKQGKIWVDDGPYTVKDALAAGLIDGIKSRLEVIAETKKAAGLDTSARLATSFGEKTKKSPFDFNNPFAIFKIFAELTRPKVKKKLPPSIGLIYASGSISNGAAPDSGMGAGGIYSLQMVAHIEKARKDKQIKAVVLRINSPGGSALASETIYQALILLKKTKPLFVSIGQVGGSGGYYIAAPADKIFVQPMSIVGSIGVVGGKVNFKGLYDWMGLTTFSYKRGGPRANISDESTPFSPEAKIWYTKNMKSVYDRFVEIVKKGRGDKLKEFEAKIAGGKVFTGRQSIKNGLADTLGNLKDALDAAAKKGKLAKVDYKVRVINPPTSFSDRLLKELGGKKGDESEIRSVDSPIRTKVSGSSKFSGALEILRKLQPETSVVLEQQLKALEVLQTEGVMVRIPYDLIFSP